MSKTQAQLSGALRPGIDPAIRSCRDPVPPSPMHAASAASAAPDPPRLPSGGHVCAGIPGIPVAT